MGETSKELFEKISAEKCWALTAKTLLNLALLRGSKSVVPLLGKGEGITAPVMGWEKYNEIVIRVMGEANNKLTYLVKEMFNIPVEDAIGAAKLSMVVSTLQMGPECDCELIEATRERAIVRFSKCGWWARYQEFGIKPGLTMCQPPHEGHLNKVLKEINPKLNLKFTKSMPREDPYCELVYEFRDE